MRSSAGIFSSLSPTSWRHRASSNTSTDYSADTHLQGLSFVSPPREKSLPEHNQPIHEELNELSEKFEEGSPSPNIIPSADLKNVFKIQPPPMDNHRHRTDRRNESSSDAKVVRQRGLAQNQHRLHGAPSIVYENSNEQDTAATSEVDQLEDEDGVFLDTFRSDEDLDGFLNRQRAFSPPRQRGSCDDSCISSLSGEDSHYNFEPPTHQSEVRVTPMRGIQEQTDIGAFFEHLVLEDDRRKNRIKNTQPSQRSGKVYRVTKSAPSQQVHPLLINQENKNTILPPQNKLRYIPTAKGGNPNLPRPSSIQTRSTSAASGLSLESASQSSSQYHGRSQSQGHIQGQGQARGPRPGSSHTHKSNASMGSQFSQYDVFSYQSVPETTIIVNGRPVNGIKKRHGHKDSISFMIEETGSNASNSNHQRSHTSTSIYEAALTGDVEQMEIMLSESKSVNTPAPNDGSFDEKEQETATQSMSSKSTKSRVKKVKEELKYVVGKIVPSPLKHVKKKKTYDLSRSHGCLA